MFYATPYTLEQPPSFRLAEHHFVKAPPVGESSSKKPTKGGLQNGCQLNVLIRRTTHSRGAQLSPCTRLCETKKGTKVEHPQNTARL